MTLIYVALVSVTLIAAVTDTRTGLIPNALTLPVAVAAPLAQFAFGGPGAGMASLLGLFMCGAVPLVFFRLGAMGGGDVKLFAALGALAGPQLGLEVQLASVCIAFGYALVRMARTGKVKVLLSNSLRVTANLLWPSARRHPLPSVETEHVRMGAAIFAGACVCVLADAYRRGLV